MNKLLATSAIALVALSGAASAQSVLERVLGQIDNATNLASVNGTFANIAENIGTPGTTEVYIDSTGKTYTEAEWLAAQQDVDVNDYAPVPANSWVNTTTGEVLTDAQYAQLGSPSGFVDSDVGGYYKGVDGSSVDNQIITSAEFSNVPAVDAYVPPTLSRIDLLENGLVEGIDGSITNTIDGITDVTQQAVAGVVNAVEYNMPTMNFGNMATTALGAVNTGNITLGVNSAVDEAKTSTTSAISAVVDQIGGSADTGAIILNVASNMTGVNGSITNTMTEVNGTIGNLSTTALGAVNTGTIISGVDTAVAGIIGSSGSTTGASTGTDTTTN